MKIIKSLQNTGLILMASGWMISCSTPATVLKTWPSTTARPNYASLDVWAAHPRKADPSDSIPDPLKEAYIHDSTVDVFFIHPTSYTGKHAENWNAELSDSALNQKTDGSSIYYQASAFNQYNVFAPRYRQAHIQSYFTTDTTMARKALDFAYEDVKAAFEYFLQYENHGKPIIIASHSQGTTHAKRLLKDYFEGKELQSKLVAAYILGMAVAPEYFVSLPPCKDSIQTGCFISWRTFRRDYEPDYQSSSRQSIVVNPLSWTTDTSYAPVSLHKGAVLRNFNRIEPLVNDAQVHGDLLWVSRPVFPHSKLYKAKNYHIGDINLFYINLRENLSLRVRSYKQNL